MSHLAVNLGGSAEWMEKVTEEYPRSLFSGPYRHLGNFFSGHTYDIAPDGKKFLMIRNSGMASNHINVVLNWFEELKRLVPTDR